MTEYRRYTREQLKMLRSSPLCQRPDALPSIEQWMEGTKPKEDPASNQRQRRPGARPEDASTDNNLLTRPTSNTSLPVRRAGTAVAMRGNAGQGAMGDFSLFPSTSSGDDLSLGPPIMNFTSNNRTARSQEQKSTGDKGDFQDGFFKMRPETSKEKGSGQGPGQRRPRDQNQAQQGEEGWTNVRRGKTSHTEDDKSAVRWDERERGEGRRPRDGEALEAPLRRNGVGRGRFTDSTWIRPENGADSGEREQTSANRGDLRTMSWRDRDNNKDRSTREWGRGRQHDSHQQIEEDPEWMTDDIAGQQPQGEKHKRTQEDFQRWKEQQKMKSGNVPATVEKEISDPMDQIALTGKPPAPTSKSTGGIPTVNKFGFGVFEEATGKRAEAEKSDPAMQRPPAVKTKSRFDQLFNKKEEPAQSPPPPMIPMPDQASGSAEDKLGFERILMMLGSKSTPPNHQDGRPPPPQSELPQNVSSPNQHLHQPSREMLAESRQQRDGFMEEVMANQMAAQERNQMRQQQMTPDFAMLMNSRGGPPMQNQGRGNAMQQAQLQQQAGPQGRPMDSHTDFLLNLMNQRQNQEQQQGQQRMNDMLEFAGAQYGPPKGGMPAQSQMGQPPHQRLAPSAPPGLEHHQRMMAEQHQEQMRRQQAHGGPPPGFFDHDGMPGGPPMPGPVPEGMVAPPPPGLARRNTSDGAPNGGLGPRGAAPAQASNLGIPSMHGVPPGMGRMEQMLMMRNGPGPGPGGPGGPMPGEPGRHHLPPPGLMPQGPGNGPPSAGPTPSGAGNNIPNGGNPGGNNNMRGPPGGPGPMGPPPGFQGGMMPPGMGGGPGGPMPPMNINMHGMGPGNGPLPPGFPQMGPPPGFFGPMGPGGPGPNGPNGPLPSGPGGPGMGPGGPGMPPPGFFGRGFPPGFEAEMNRPQRRDF